MIRLLALWAASVAIVILFLVLREERLAAQGKVPLGRLRRLWFRNENRRAPRYRVNWTVQYQPVGVESALGARTRDLSQTGIGLVVPERLTPGSQLGLELTLPSRPTPLKLMGRVIWSKEVPAQKGETEGTRLFFVGIHFLGIDSQITKLLAEGLQGGESKSLPAGRQEQAPVGSDPTGADPKAKRYAALKRWLWMIDTVLTLGGFLVLLKTGAAVGLSGWVLETLPHWPLQTAGYVGILGFGMTAITFPLDWYGSFRLEHRFGLSTQRWGQWLLEYVKRLGLGAALGLLLVEGLMALIRLDPERWWGWMALLWTAWSVLLTRVAPQWLIPLFYRQSPLKDASLKERLQALLARCGAQAHDLLEVNLSRSTKKANACLCGLGRSRRILLSDTLLANYPAEEVEVVVAHEAGHHRLHHLPLGIALSAAAMGLGCFLVHRLVKTWRVPLGIPRWDDPAVLMIVGLGLTLVNLLLMPLLHGLWRSLEARADRFSLEQTQNPKAFIATMRRLAEQNLAEVSPPKWVEWFFYDHPSIARRVAMAEAFERG